MVALKTYFQSSILLFISRLKSFLPMNFTRWNKNSLIAFLDSHVIHYPTPISLTYAWSFGALAGICLASQMLTGFF